MEERLSRKPSSYSLEDATLILAYLHLLQYHSEYRAAHTFP